jgi:general stress protein YciG
MNSEMNENMQEARSVNNSSSGEEQQRTGKSTRGFASMDPERRRQVASSGGRTAHQQGVAHKWSREEASAAGRKGQELRRRREQ